MTRLVTVINIKSFSYSGTTWINLLLGSHPRAVAIGPPDRVADMFYAGDGDAGKACRVHGSNCGFWKRFFSEADRTRNFYLQIADILDRDYVVINNPLGGRAVADLQHPGVLVKPVTVVRDGRAILESYAKYHPGADFVDTLLDWFCPFAAGLPFDEQSPDLLSVRYEDVVADQVAFARRAGQFAGIGYSPDCVRYWEYEHHLVRCNPGPLGILRRYLGHGFTGAKAGAMEERYSKLLREPAASEADRSWEERWGPRKRLLFDLFAGDMNEQWGYQRDRFGLNEMGALASDLAEARPDLVRYLPWGGEGGGLRNVMRERSGDLRDMLRLRDFAGNGLRLSARQLRWIGAAGLGIWLASLVLVGMFAALKF